MSLCKTGKPWPELLCREERALLFLHDCTATHHPTLLHAALQTGGMLVFLHPCTVAHHQLCCMLQRTALQIQPSSHNVTPVPLPMIADSGTAFHSPEGLPEQCRPFGNMPFPGIWTHPLERSWSPFCKMQHHGLGASLFIVHMVLVCSYEVSKLLSLCLNWAFLRAFMHCVCLDVLFPTASIESDTRWAPQLHFSTLCLFCYF